MQFGDILSLFDHQLLIIHQKWRFSWVFLQYSQKLVYSIPATFRSMNYLFTSICSKFVKI